MQFRDLQKQYQVLKPKMDAAVLDVMASAKYISGPQVKALEDRLAEYVGVKHCISCANGTDALQLCLMAWGVGPGDAIFVPDFTFFATGEVAANLGATAVFYDVDADTFNGSARSLEKAIQAVLAEGKLTPKVVKDVDLFGLPADHNAIGAVAKKYGLKFVEDGAQGFGGSLHGKKNCSFGDAATTSFFPAKPLGCYGDGGAIFTDDDELDTLLRSFCVHGKGTYKYDNVRLGMNSRLDTLQAAILDVKMDAFVDYELDAVNKAAEMYNEELKGVDVILPTVPEGWYSSWAQYTVRLKSREQRDAVQAAMKDMGVPTMIYYPKPMHTQLAFEGKGYYVECSVTEELCGTVLSLPMHPYLDQATVHEVVESLKKALKNV